MSFMETSLQPRVIREDGMRMGVVYVIIDFQWFSLQFL